MFAKIGELYGRLDILVNNAADGAFVDLYDMIGTAILLLSRLCQCSR